MKNVSILSHTILPVALHGKNPRTIMGETEWNKVKKEKQKLLTIIVCVVMSMSLI